MSKYNTCEKEHQDIDGFFAALAEASDSVLDADEFKPTFSTECPANIVPVAGYLALNTQVLQQHTGGF